MDFSENFERPRSDSASQRESAGAVVDASAGGAIGGGGGRAAVNPSALTVEQLAKALGVSADVVRRHVAAGAPADFGGRMNLVHYAAWLNSRLAQAGREEAGRVDGRRGEIGRQQVGHEVIGREEDGYGD